MTDFRSYLSALVRPRLLVRAARLGLQDYRRERDLARLLGTDRARSVEAVLGVLIDAEATLEATRQAGDAGYSIARHIETLIAMMAEVRLMPQQGHSA